MEDFRKAMYAACRQMNMAIVPKDIGARVMAYVGLQGGDERTVMCPRLRTELEHLQELYHINVQLVSCHSKETPIVPHRTKYKHPFVPL